MTPADPIVSVLIVCYRHEAFIRQSVESALAQRTDFPVEIIVSDDASPDASPRIIAELARAHPDRIRPLLQPRNLGVVGNSKAVFRAARGHYIALVEGDDFWTHPDKLARQVALLESQPHLAASGHAARHVDAAGVELPSHELGFAGERLIHLSDLLEANLVPTASLVFRRALLPEIPVWAEPLPMLDWPILFELAARGPIHFSSEAWCAYRVHGGGVWSGQQRARRLQGILDFYARALAHFPAELTRDLPAARKRVLLDHFKQADLDRDYAAARRILRQYLALPPDRYRLPPHQLRAIWRAFVTRPAPR